MREEDGEEVVFTLPDFVEQGDELGEIALLVIRARSAGASSRASAASDHRTARRPSTGGG